MIPSSKSNQCTTVMKSKRLSFQTLSSRKLEERKWTWNSRRRLKLIKWSRLLGINWFRCQINNTLWLKSKQKGYLNPSIRLRVISRPNFRILRISWCCILSTKHFVWEIFLWSSLLLISLGIYLELRSRNLF